MAILSNRFSPRLVISSEICTAGVSACYKELGKVGGEPPLQVTICAGADTFEVRSK